MGTSTKQVNILKILGILVIGCNLVLILVPIVVINIPILLLIYFLIRCRLHRKPKTIFSWQQANQWLNLLGLLAENQLNQQYEQLCMNCGHALLTRNGHYNLVLQKEQEQQRFQYQLYDYTVSGIKNLKSLRNKRVLDIGTGKGAGLHFIHHFKATSYCLGIDSNPNHVQYADNHFKNTQGLEFRTADAHSFYYDLIKKEAIQLFDIIICVESGHQFQELDKFLQQVYHSLNDGGYFCIADFVELNQIPQYERQLQALNLKLIEKEDITITVLHAIKLNRQSKQQSIMQKLRSLITQYIKKLLCIQNNGIYEKLNQRQAKYLIYLLKKKGHDFL